MWCMSTMSCQFAVLLCVCLLSMVSLLTEAVESDVEFTSATRSPRPERQPFESGGAFGSENSHVRGGRSEDDFDWAHLMDEHPPHRHGMHHEPFFREIGLTGNAHFDQPKPIRKCRNRFQNRRGDYPHVKLPWAQEGPLFRGEEAWPDDFPRRRPHGHPPGAPQHPGMTWDHQGRRERQRGLPEQRLQDADTHSQPTSSPKEKHEDKPPSETLRKADSTEVSFSEVSKSQSAPSAPSEADRTVQGSVPDKASSNGKVSGESKDSHQPHVSDSHDSGATRPVPSDGGKVGMDEKLHKEEPPRPINPRIRDRNMRRDNKDGLFGPGSFVHS